MAGEPLPDAAFAAALAALPGCGGAALRALLAPPRTAAVAWEAVADGRTLALEGVAAVLGRRGADASRRWQMAAAQTDVAAGWAGLVALGVTVEHLGGTSYPANLVCDPQPPPVLFRVGEAPLDRRPAVAVVGTRRCTGYGLDVARELGRDLAATGVPVVSGLALGIDGAAHEGALRADPSAAIAVVASGLDVVYPRRHRRLWQRVAERGVIVTEAPLGTRPEPWRFPRRNRLIAALATVVVVVESHAAGGSLLTVSAALARGSTVMAVPGSVRSAASVGTNRLLSEGAVPVTDTLDVLAALSLAAPGARRSEPDVALSDDERVFLDAVDWSPTPTEMVLRRTGAEVRLALRVLARLEVAGLVRNGGGWWERVAACARGHGS